MREIRTSGSEGGGAGNSTGSPYPYQDKHTLGFNGAREGDRVDRPLESIAYAQCLVAMKIVAPRKITAPAVKKPQRILVLNTSPRPAKKRPTV